MRNDKPFNKNSTVSKRSKQWLGATGLKEYIKGYHNIFIQNIISKKTALIVKPHDIAKCRTLFQKLKKLVRIFCCAISLTSKQKLNINELTSIMMQILAQPNLCAFSLPSAVSFSNQKITKKLTFSNRLETKIKKKTTITKIIRLLTYLIRNI
ncbi:hypothetical protein [Catenovulum adriaticum]|uniref:Uncharacterized protein n=1 Tax=Catenovulum adriaticum TaxID=2984846 RepID=A0ABY7ANY0_9ALTE|nr:hypothetical protein [Catenovulum sp. TS8]WAJ71272.1 hypothetical protein OLW01_05595 [Catenovulum sp. TS8]